MAGSRLTWRSNHRHSTRRATMRPTSPAAVLRSHLTGVTRPIHGASWAGASIVCCCLTPTRRSHCVRAWRGHTTGSATHPSCRYSKRFRARASSSTAQRPQRTPRSPPPAQSIASPVASPGSRSSTASSPRIPPPTPAPAPCDIRGDRRTFRGDIRASICELWPSILWPVRLILAIPRNSRWWNWP